MGSGSPSPSTRGIFVPKVLAAVALLSAVISAAGFTLLVSPAQSTPEYMGQFNATYDTRGSKLDSCLTCHTRQAGGAESMNPYGTDFGKNNHDFAGVEGLDSDGDGFGNIDEIKAETFPGDPNEQPEFEAQGAAEAPAALYHDHHGPLDAIPDLRRTG